MKRLSVAIRMLAALSLAMSMLAAFAATTSAAPNPAPGIEAFWDGETYPPLFGARPSDDECSRYNCDLHGYPIPLQEVYFPAVGNADESTGLGAAQTSITIQNIDSNDTYIFVYVGDPEDDDGVDLDNWDVVEYAYLSGGASKTFQASDLEIPVGDVRPVVVVAYTYIGELHVVTCGMRSAANFYDYDTGICYDPSAIAGVAKQAVTGDSLPFTSAVDTAVSGYNAIGARELGFFDELYFPIVQTNCGPGGCWNSILRIANMGVDDNAAVTVRFFPADDGSGSLQTGFQLQGLVDVGETWSIDLSEWVPEGWVGSAHVYTDDAVGAIVDRVKVGTDMWITNTAANKTTERMGQGYAQQYPYVLYAPDVRTDYNGWNTGINVANTVDGDTDVSIQYFGSNGNAPLAQTRRLAPHGMTYFYNPSDPSEDRCEQPATDVPGCEFIGGAIIISTNPVAAVIDGVKYFGNDVNVGQAFSYSATGNAYDVLHAALVQKGNPANGMGATSGINFMNPNDEATTVEATWLNPSGFGATNFGSSIVWVPAYSTGFVYTMFHKNLPNGYVGSALVNSELPIVATTANVDYQVDGDGTAIWNLSNPCGFFRQADWCLYFPPWEPQPVTSTLTKTVLVNNPFDDASGEEPTWEPLAGVLVSYTSTDYAGYPVSGSGFTGADGSVTFAVRSGWHSITIDAEAPAGFGYVGTASDEVFVFDNEAVTVINELTQVVAEGTGTLTKVLETAVEYDSMESEVYFCSVEAIDFAECSDTAIVAAGYGEEGNADETVSALVPAGTYQICSAVALTINGSVLTSGPACETHDPETDLPIYVVAGGSTTVTNVFDEQTSGILNVFVRDDETDLPLAGAMVSIFIAGTDIRIYHEATDAFGDAGPAFVSAGTYTITVEKNDTHEQESTTITYSPQADAADGGMLDSGEDADVVVALDPIIVNGILDVDVILNTLPIPGGFLVSVFESAVGDSGTACLGAPVTSGLTVDGTFSTSIAAGEYCVQAGLIGAVNPVVAAQATVTAGDPADDSDATLVFVIN